MIAWGCLVLGGDSSDVDSSHEFRMGCFNIENLGATKASRAAIMSVLARVVKRYDLLYIQELSDKPKEDGVCGLLTGNVICQLIKEANVTRDLEMSPRLSATSNGAEQYALLYDPFQFEVLSSWVVNDSKTGKPAYDKYMRPPMVTTIRSRLTDRVFAAGVCHTKPDNATEEVVNLAGELVTLEKDISSFAVICGDFNTKFSAADWEKYYSALPNNGSKYGMEIENGEVTGVLSGATLDRIITTPDLHAVASKGQAFWFNDTSKGGYSMNDILSEGCNTYLSSCTSAAATKAVSDHFPVEVTFRFTVLSVASHGPSVSFVLVGLFILLQIILAHNK